MGPWISAATIIQSKKRGRSRGANPTLGSASNSAGVNGWGKEGGTGGSEAAARGLPDELFNGLVGLVGPNGGPPDVPEGITGVGVGTAGREESVTTSSGDAAGVEANASARAGTGGFPDFVPESSVTTASVTTAELGVDTGTPATDFPGSVVAEDVSKGGTFEDSVVAEGLDVLEAQVGFPPVNSAVKGRFGLPGDVIGEGAPERGEAGRFLRKIDWVKAPNPRVSVNAQANSPMTGTR